MASRFSWLVIPIADKAMIRFVDVVARTLPTSRLKSMAEEMLLSEEECYLLLERCAGMKTIDQCDRLSPRRQRDLLPILNTKVQIWVLSALDTPDGFFNPREQKALLSALQKLQKQRPTEVPE